MDGPSGQLFKGNCLPGQGAAQIVFVCLVLVWRNFPVVNGRDNPCAVFYKREINFARQRLVLEGEDERHCHSVFCCQSSTMKQVRSAEEVH